MDMNIKKSVSLLLVGMCFFAPQCFAAQNYAVQLEWIKRIERQEERGDELYFNVTEYSNKSNPTFYQVPSFPTHWLSQYLENVKDVVLWQKPLQEGESVQLIFSLVERDAPPWNVDDLLGSVKLNVKLDSGHLQKEWKIPNKEITERVEGKTNTFDFEGDEGHYRVKFRLVPLN